MEPGLNQGTVDVVDAEPNVSESMSGYGIEDVPTIQMESDASSALDGSDSVQESLMAEAVIQVTENDEVIGPICSLDSHFEVVNTTAFQCFTCLIYQVDLCCKKEHHTKSHFPGVWANSCCFIHYILKKRWN